MDNRKGKTWAFLEVQVCGQGHLNSILDYQVSAGSRCFKVSFVGWGIYFLFSTWNKNFNFELPSLRVVDQLYALIYSVFFIVLGLYSQGDIINMEY